MSSDKLKKALVAVIVLILAAMVGAFIYFSLVVTSTSPPESTLEEREEWTRKLEKETLYIDSGTRNVELTEFLHHRIKTAEFGIWRNEFGYMGVVFTSPNGEYTQVGEVRIGDESLICDLGGISLDLWIESGENPIIVLQGEEERLIFNPANPVVFNNK